MSTPAVVLQQSDDTLVCGGVPASLVSGLTPNELVYGAAGGGVAQSTVFQVSTSLDQIQVSFSKANGQNGVAVTNSSNANTAYADVALINDLGSGSRADVYYTSSTYAGSDSAPSSLTFATAAGSMSELVFSPNNIQAIIATPTQVQIPVGQVLMTAISAPGTPAAGKSACYVDSTAKNLAVKNDAGIVNHGAQSVTQAAGLALSALADDGSWSKLAFQPPLTACTDYVSVSCQGGTSDIGTGGSNSAVQIVALHDGGSVRHHTSGTWANSSPVAIDGSGNIVAKTPGVCFSCSGGTCDVVNGACGGTSTLGGPGQYIQQTTYDGYGKEQSGVAVNLAAGSAKLNYFLVAVQPGGTSGYAGTSTTALTGGGVTIEYPIGVAGTTYTIAVNVISNTITPGAGNTTFFISQNGTISGPLITVPNGTTGVSTASHAASGATSDTWGLFVSGTAPTGGAMTFTATVTVVH